MVNYQVHESEPKTRMGKRSLALDPATVAALGEHRLARSRSAPIVGSAWTTGPGVHLAGRTAPPSGPDHRLVPAHAKRVVEQAGAHAGLPPIRLHDVRHSYATAALAAGIPAKVVSERLGHANIAITLDVYSHVIPGMDAQAASAVARLILDGSETAPGLRPAAMLPILLPKRATPSTLAKEVRRERAGQAWWRGRDLNPRPLGYEQAQRPPIRVHPIPPHAF